MNNVLAMSQLRFTGIKQGRQCQVKASHISGSFWISDTAAIGMPKLEAGPQKSGLRQYELFGRVGWLGMRVEQK